jgi:AcrR family transcriptional regulator
MAPVPETQSRTERKKAKARADIVAAALGLFAEQGYESTTVAQIMDRADYGLGTFYNHFAGKQELVRAAVADRLAAARGELMQVLAGQAPAVEKLRDVVLSAGRVIAEDRPLFSLYFETFRARQLGVVQAHAPAFGQLFDGLVVEAQRAGDIRADVPARLVGEYLQAILQSSTTSTMELPLLENLGLKVEILFTGLRPA